MGQIRLILSEDVPNLGEAGELVSVKPGYARNYLLPSKKALPATEARVKELEHHRQVIAAKVARDQKTLRAERSRIEGTAISIEVQAGEEGKLFGSVTAANVAELLAAQGIEVDRRKIALDPIKEVGDYEVEVKLHREVSAKVKLSVTAAS